MEQTVKELLIRLSDIHQMVLKTKEEIKHSEKGSLQVHNLRLKTLKNRFEALKSKILKKFQGTYSTVKYSLKGPHLHEVYIQTFVNLSRQEIEDALNLLASISELELRILEFNVITTSLKRL